MIALTLGDVTVGGLCLACALAGVVLMALALLLFAWFHERSR